MTKIFFVVFHLGAVACLTFVGLGVYEMVSRADSTLGIWVSVAVSVIGGIGWIASLVGSKLKSTANQERIASASEQTFSAAKAGAQTAWHSRTISFFTAKPVYAVGLGVAVVLAYVAFVSLEQKKIRQGASEDLAKGQCQQFINREFNNGSRLNPAFIADSWTKRGMLVVEIGWKDRPSDRTYRSRLCVYDPERGKLSSPGAIGRVRWER